MTGSRDRDLISRIESLEQEVYGVDRKSGLKGKVEDVWALSKMGRGALWAAVKIGTVVATIAAIVAAIWGALKGGP